MKTVRTFGNLAEAGFASSLLESAGIKALLADEASYALGYGLVTGGLRVQVDEADFERALTVLEAGPDAPPTAAKEVPPEAEGRMPTGLFVALAAAAALVVFAGVQARKQWGTNTPSSFTEMIDNDHDGRADTTYYYERRRLARIESDRNHDGYTDEWSFYDSEGRMARMERDQNFDGKADVWDTCKNGEIVAEEGDTDFNGLVDYVSTIEYGITRQMDHTPNKSRIVTRREIFGKDGVSEEWVDKNRDGVFDYKIVVDPFGERSEPIALDPAKASEPQ